MSGERRKGGGAQDKGSEESEHFSPVDVRVHQRNGCMCVCYWLVCEGSMYVLVREICMY